jgi:hypothetical protein
MISKIKSVDAVQEPKMLAFPEHGTLAMLEPALGAKTSTAFCAVIIGVCEDILFGVLCLVRSSRTIPMDGERQYIQLKLGRVAERRLISRLIFLRPDSLTVMRRIAEHLSMVH